MVAKFAAESVRQASITDIHLGFLIAKEIVQGRRTSQCGTNVYLPGSWKVIWQPDSDGFESERCTQPSYAFTSGHFSVQFCVLYPNTWVLGENVRRQFKLGPTKIAF
jgi:hypothetical protein